MWRVAQDQHLERASLVGLHTAAGPRPFCGELVTQARGPAMKCVLKYLGSPCSECPGGVQINAQVPLDMQVTAWAPHKKASKQLLT